MAPSYRLQRAQLTVETIGEDGVGSLCNPGVQNHVMSKRQDLRVTTWNIQGNVGIDESRFPRIIDAITHAAPDILLLQEVSVTKQLPGRLRRALGPKLAHWHFTAPSGGTGHGTAIASRFELAPVHPKVPSRWAHSIALAVIKTPSAPTSVFSVHIPNGSAYGWDKIATFETLASLIDPSMSTILGGDFNEPMRFLADGSLHSFMCHDDGRVAKTWKGQPGLRWQVGVESILGPSAALRHSWLTLNPGLSEITHVTHGKPRFFDHVLASKHFEVIDAGFEHGWRTCRPRASDHSGAWATLRRIA